MDYLTKYIIEISDSHYIYFYEQSKEVYFGIEEKDNYFKENKIISPYQYGIYQHLIYVYFDGCIYRADTDKMQIRPILWDVYNVYFLNECIIMLIKKNSRRDEFIKLIPNTENIEKIGNLIQPNILR